MAKSQCERALDRLRPTVTAAATAYEARWTLAALDRVDSELHAKLTRQIGLWHAATRGEDAALLERHGQGLVRGYQRAAETMALSGEGDDAFYIGSDPASGLTIAIGHQMASAAHAQAAWPGAIFLTPDEVCALVARSLGTREIEALVAIKRAWPGALITDVTESESEKRDADNDEQSDDA